MWKKITLIVYCKRSVDVICVWGTEMCIDIHLFMHANDALNQCVAIWFDELA